MAEGAGATPDIIYARGAPADPTPDPAFFDHKESSLIHFEIGFYRDLECHTKFTMKTEKYHPFLCALRRYLGRIELVCIPIGNAGTALHDTATDIATALTKVRTSIAAQRNLKGHKTHESSTTAFVYD